MNENVLDGRHAQAAEFAARKLMRGGGEMGALMRAHDWSSSSIKPRPQTGLNRFGRSCG